MFKRYLKLLVFTVAALGFAAFAVANRDLVAISLFPLPYEAELPVFLLAILCFTLGVIVAGLALNLRASKNRRLYKAEHKRVVALENELGGLRAEQTSLTAIP